MPFFVCLHQVEQRLYEMARLVKQFKDTLTDSGLLALSYDLTLGRYIRSITYFLRPVFHSLSAPQQCPVFTLLESLEFICDLQVYVVNVDLYLWSCALFARWSDRSEDDGIPDSGGLKRARPELGADKRDIKRQLRRLKQGTSADDKRRQLSMGDTWGEEGTEPEVAGAGEAAAGRKHKDPADDSMNDVHALDFRE